MRVAIHGFSTSRLMRRMSTCARRAATQATLGLCADTACACAVGHGIAKPASGRGNAQRAASSEQRAAQRTLLSSSGGYLGKVCRFGGPSAIAFLLNGCRDAACCAMAARAKGVDGG